MQDIFKQRQTSFLIINHSDSLTALTLVVLKPDTFSCLDTELAGLVCKVSKGCTLTRFKVKNRPVNYGKNEQTTRQKTKIWQQVTQHTYCIISLNELRIRPTQSIYKNNFLIIDD